MITSERPMLAGVLALTCTLAGAAEPAQLSVQAGCSACHAPDRKLVGPSWKDVAARYKGQAGAMAQMIERVRKGSNGVWGAVPMVPVPPKTLNDSDLKAVLAWVLQTPT